MGLAEHPDVPAVDAARRARDAHAFIAAVDALGLPYDLKQRVYQRAARAELRALPETERTRVCRDVGIVRAGRQLRIKACKAVLDRVWGPP